MEQVVIPPLPPPSEKKSMYISLCVLILGLSEKSPVPQLSFKASKYKNRMASSKDGRGEIRLEAAEDSKVKGGRQMGDLTVETFTRDPPSSSNPTPKGESNGEIKKINFFSGNPFVEVTKGILHLYKENERTTLTNDDGAPEERSEMLCMLAVPTTLNCRELLQFIAPFHESIEMIKIIRDSSPSKYMVLLKFESQSGADAFYKTMHGAKFNSFEDEMCKLAYVAIAETLSESNGAGFPLMGHTELPICPVCLERMDESVDGILTILCNHSFHSGCLAKWSDESCPVCRYLQTPEMKASNECGECGATDSLWICLICGHIGCGRYLQGHAFKHFCETQHCYAIQPDNLRVWDYVGDNFVHRLLQNKGDGKLVEVSTVPSLDDTNCSEEADEKVDSMQLEFSYLLTTQLEAQRAYFEDKLRDLQSDLVKQIEGLNGKVEALINEKGTLEIKVDTLTKEKAHSEKKCVLITSRLNKIMGELGEEREMNKHLQSDQGKWKDLLEKTKGELEVVKKEKDVEVTDLKEQVRDLMFFLDAQQKVEESSMKDEIVQGQVIVPEGPSTSGKKERKKKK